MVLLTSANILNFVDRKLPVILIESIKRDLHLTDTQIGLVNGVIFTAVYGLVGLVVARFADRFSRKLVLAGSVIWWSFATMLGGFAQNFTHFAATRIGVAVGESGCTPPSHSILSDYFAPSKRPAVYAFFMAGSPFGGMIGLALGGIINDLANWRTAMFVVMAPGLLASALILFTVREPKRGEKETQPILAGEAPAFMTTVRTLWSRVSFRYIALGCALFGMGSTAQTTFSAGYVMRTFGLSSTYVGIGYGLMVGLTGAVGAIGGGLLAGWVSKRDLRWSAWVPAIGFLASLPFAAAAYLSPTPAGYFFFTTPAHLLPLFYLGPAFAMTHALVDVRMRAVASAIVMLAIQGVGASLGPVMTGLISDLLRPVYGQLSLRYALLVALVAVGGAGLSFVAAGLYLRRDLAKARADFEPE